MKKKFSLIRLAAAILAMLMFSSMSGCEFGVFTSEELDNPKQTIVDFVDAMQARNFDQAAADEAMSYVGNYSTMGFEKYAMVTDDSIEKVLFEFLRDSYAVSFADSDLSPVSSPCQGRDISVSGKQAFVTFDFTSLDFSLLSAPLGEEVTNVGSERMYDGVSYETEEQAMELVEEIFPSVYVEDFDFSEYCVTRQITMELTYTRDGWKMVVNDDFYNALLGK